MTTSTTSPDSNAEPNDLLARIVGSAALGGTVTLVQIWGAPGAGTSSITEALRGRNGTV